MLRRKSPPPPRLLLVAAVTALAAAQTAGAAEVYRWVDADGVLHFSDVRPAGPTAMKLHIEDRNPPGYDPAADPNNIVHTAATGRDAATPDGTPAALPPAATASASQTVVYVPAPPADDPWISYGRRSVLLPPFFPTSPGQPPVFAPGVQQQALVQADLDGPRPASINSRAHAERVQRSRALTAIASDLATTPDD